MMSKSSLSSKKKTGFGQQGQRQQPAAAGGFGGFGGGGGGGGGFGFGSAPQAAAGSKPAFGFQAPGFQAGGAAAGAAGGAAGAPFGGVAGNGAATKVGFGFGAPQQQPFQQGNGMMATQQQQQQPQHYVLTEEQKRQNKLDRILEKQGKLESLLPTPGVVDRILPPTSSQQQLQQYPSQQQPQTQTHNYQSRGQSLSHLRGSLTDAADASRGRPLSSGIIGTASSSGRNNPIMSPEVLLGRRAKKLTIDHSHCEDMTVGLPSPYSKISSHKKEFARSVDQAAISSREIGSSRGSSSSSSATAMSKKAKQEEQPPPPIKPSFDPIGTPPPQSRNRYESDDEDPEQMDDVEEDGDYVEEDVEDEGGRDKGAKRRSQSLCPRLSREGYFTRPDMSILRAMSPPELASVPHFTVYMPNTGSITWKGRTDVRGLDLDELVVIEHQAVTVYPPGSDKPEEGSGLNKAAEVTLYNIFPKSNASQSKQLNFVNKLRMSNDSSDATFESYDRDSGTWVFSTSHFSKHGLSDSDSDSDSEMEEGDGGEGDMSLALQLPDTTAAKPQPKLKGLLPVQPKATGDLRRKGGSVNFSVPPAQEVGGHGRGGGIVRRNRDLQSLQRIQGNVAAQSAQAIVHEDTSRHTQREREQNLKGKSDAYAHLLEASRNFQPRYEHGSDAVFEISAEFPASQQQQYGFPHPTHAQTTHPHMLRRDKFKSSVTKPQPAQKEVDISSKPDISFVEAGKSSSRKLFAVEESPCMRLLKAVKDRHTAPAQHQAPVRCCTSMRTVEGGRAQRPVDAALCLGRSFRVGWSADGKLLHAGNINFNKLLPAETSGAVPDSSTSAVSTFTGGVMTTHDSPSSCHGVVRLHTIDTMLHHGSDSFDLIPRLMSSLKNSSLSTTPAASPQGQVDRRSLVPIWSLPKADVNQWDEYVRFVNLLKQLLDDVEGAQYDRNHPCWIMSRVVSLVDAICGQEEQWIQKFKNTGVSDLMMPLYELRGSDGDMMSEKDVSLWERRRELISNWLKSICEDDVDQVVESIPVSDRPESVLLALLCCGRVEDAVEVAERAGLFRLAMLLCQAGGDEEVRFMLQQQVELWEDHGAAAGDRLLLPEDMLAVYKILGGKYEETESVLSPIDWPNAVGVLFWFCNSSVGKLSDALVTFDYARRSNPTIRHPLLRKQEDEEEGESDSLLGEEAEAQYHALFRLLEVFFFQPQDTEDMDTDEESNGSARELQAKAIASLRPRGYSTDMLDYRGSYLSLLFLEATAVLRQTPSSDMQGQEQGHEGMYASAIVRQHMVGQLLSQGEWGWAVFVCMQIEDHVVRSYAVRDLVLRFGGSREGVGVSVSVSDEEALAMSEQLSHLRAHCRVPEQLLLEAEAYRHCYTRNTFGEAEALHTCGMWQEAASLICGGIAPCALFASSSSAALVQPLLQDVEDTHQLEGKEIDAWNLEGGSLLSFLDLKNRALAMTRDGCRDIDAIAELVEDAGCLLEQLTDNAFGLFKTGTCDSASTASGSPPSSSLAHVVVDDMGTFLFKTIIRYWACDSSLVQEERLRGHLQAAPILDDYRCEVLRLFPSLAQLQ